MPPVAPMSASVRDITVEVRDSCNCCWSFFRRPVPATTLVYVNSDGIAVRYDPRKAVTVEYAAAQTIQNLLEIISSNANHAQVSRAEFQGAVEQAVGITLSKENPPRITLGLIQRVNDAIKETFTNMGKAV